MTPLIIAINRKAVVAEFLYHIDRTWVRVYSAVDHILSPGDI